MALTYLTSKQILTVQIPQLDSFSSKSCEWSELYSFPEDLPKLKNTLLKLENFHLYKHKVSM